MNVEDKTGLDTTNPQGDRIAEGAELDQRIGVLGFDTPEPMHEHIIEEQGRAIEKDARASNAIPFRD